jgi:hypothetical protein
MELWLANQHCISHNIQYDHRRGRLGEISQKLCRITFCQTTWFPFFWDWTKLGTTTRTQYIGLHQDNFIMKTSCWLPDTNEHVSCCPYKCKKQNSFCIQTVLLSHTVVYAHLKTDVSQITLPYFSSSYLTP